MYSCNVMIRFRSVLAAICVGVIALAVQVPSVSAQGTPQLVGDPIPHEKVLSTSVYRDCGLRKEAVNAFVHHRPALLKSKRADATIQVSYGSNVPPEAQAAFDRAADVWETHVSSPATIRIQASYEALGSGVLAAAGPNTFYGRDATGDGEVDAIVGDALAGALLGEAPRPQETDIIVNVNSERDDWHFGEAPAPPGTVDFTSVALHEIGHGLNYLDLFSVEEGQGEYFADSLEGNRVVGVYDRQVLEAQDEGSLVALTNEDAYSNPSETLGEALTGDQLFFGGDASEATADLGDGPPRPKLYAPSPYASGSSVAHLDEDTYPFETQDALMTPIVNQAETNRQPGPILCGQLRDMGWPLGPGCEQYFRDLFAVEVQAADSGTGSLTLSWTEQEGTDIQEYIVDRRYFGGEFQTVKQVDASDLSGPSLTVANLGLGAFTFRLRWLRADGTMGTSPERPRDTVNVWGVTATVMRRDAQERGTIDLSWTVPPGTPSNFRYQVERREGRGGAFQQVATVPQEGKVVETQSKQYTADRRTPGRYEYRVTARDGAGNAVTSASREVQVDFEGDVYALGPYPNPVRETASFNLTARQSQSVTVEVYNTLGERVYTARREVRAQDPVLLSIDVSRWASGVYFLRLRGRKSVGRTEKMVVVK